MCITSDLSKRQALKILSTFFFCLLILLTIRPAAKATEDPPKAMKVDPSVAFPKEAQRGMGTGTLCLIRIDILCNE